MQTREQAFVRDRGEQQQLLSRARAALAEQKAEAERLKAEFDRQEAELAEQEKLLAQRVGHLGELFGVVRQSAGDIAGQWQDSLLNVQYPERLKQLRSLAESRALPSADDLDAFWMTLLEDLAASGRVERVQLPVVGTDVRAASSRYCVSAASPPLPTTPSCATTPMPASCWCRRVSRPARA